MSAEERAAFRARKIGFVFQQFHLIPYLDVRDNVLAAALPLGPDATRAASERADALLARFGLEERAAHVPSRLSTGERQRAALARALLNGPRLLLADEPTGNLDEDNARTVFAHLREFVDGGGSVLMVTHAPDAAAAGDRTIRLARGRRVDEVAPRPL